MSTVAAPVAGPVLAAFIDAHRADPWPTRNPSMARAGRLYEAYVSVAKEAGLASGVRRTGGSDEPLLSSRDFGLALQGAGYGADRDESGRHYAGLLEVTRAELARQSVIEFLTEDIELDLVAREEARHEAEFDHGSETVVVKTSDRTGAVPVTRPDGSVVTEVRSKPCECGPEARAKAVYAVIQPEVEAFVAAREEDGTIDALVEQQFGEYLRWQEGDAHPRADEQASEHRSNVAELAAMKAAREAGKVIDWNRYTELRDLVEYYEEQ